MEYSEALEWIHSRLAFGSRPGLQRVNALLERLGEPQNKIKTVHIGGTNGKGSTVTFLRCLLEASGLQVGTFTSPYITTFNERISINNQPISDDELVALVTRFQPLVAELDADATLTGVTEFEIITAMMFVYFYEKKVDIALIEVGLGGTLDCTNVITPLITGITTIGLDHMAILGDSISQIAAQKAGIIKPGRPVVVGKLAAEALAVIRKVAQGCGSHLSEYGRDFKATDVRSLGVRGERFDFENQTTHFTKLSLKLIGAHQVENASLALELYLQLSSLLGYPLVKEKIVYALESADWPGRMEKISEQPLVILDGAHNVPAVEVLVANLQNEFAHQRLVIVFAAIHPKEVAKMLALFEELPQKELYVTTFDYPKAFQLDDYPAEELKASGGQKMAEWRKGIADLQSELQQDDMLLVTGSLYFISQVRAYLLGGNHEEKL